MWDSNATTLATCQQFFAVRSKHALQGKQLKEPGKEPEYDTETQPS